MEIRSPDPSCNQYAALTLLLSAGFDGIENKTELPPEMNLDIFKASQNELKNLGTLPQSLAEAVHLACQSEFVKTILPEVTLNAFVDAEKE